MLLSEIYNEITMTIVTSKNRLQMLDIGSLLGRHRPKDWPSSRFSRQQCLYQSVVETKLMHWRSAGDPQVILYHIGPDINTVFNFV